MRWSVIFSTSYAGSCLRGAREKEVFFVEEEVRRWEGGAEEKAAQSPASPAALNKNTRCHCVSEFKCEHRR